MSNIVTKNESKEVHIEDVTLNCLRQSYLPAVHRPYGLRSAVHLTNKGVVIHEILGHKSPKTTMLYTHLSGKDIRNIRSPLDDMEI